MVKAHVRVIYGDTDKMGVVYHGNFLRYFEIGRNEFMRARGAVYRETEERYGLLLPVVEVQASYHGPAHYDDLLTIETQLGMVARASVRFEYRVVRDGVVLASGHTLHACVDRAGKIRRLPADLLAVLTAAG